MNSKKAVRALATCAAALGLATGVTNSAQAEDGYTNGGYIADSYVSFVGCSAEIQMGTSNANGQEYARAWYYLRYSTRDQPCQGWMQRKKDSETTWTMIEGFTVAPSHDLQTVGTFYYYDGPGYKVRVCTGDRIYGNSYSCGEGF
ncbi:hypothetical protein [Streptomyces sp. NBC_01198]|uniref:hypothetical protein n=1 Tax=Streptomyces sp. NBC_01198 TaxID=2903769 RepID=UPI002E1328EC|nr:hypothetical protein OG702_14625 [Streptomyces sp. NBC_01198]